MKKIEIKIEGMHCDSCAKTIEMELAEKVDKINVNAKEGKATVEFDEKKISGKKIAGIIANLGYKVK
jgi:copper chaperone CopZ